MTLEELIALDSQRTAPSTEGAAPVEAPRGLSLEELTANEPAEQERAGMSLEELTGGVSQLDDTPLDMQGEEDLDLRDFKYAYDSASTFTGNAADYMEARLPLGNLTMDGYVSPDEIYGEGFMDMSVDERRVRIRQAKDEQLAQEYPVISKLKAEGNYKGGVAGFAGSVVGTLVDPTTFLPMGQKVRTAMLIGTGVGAVYSIMEDLVSEDGKVDVNKAAITAAGGGILSGVFAKTLQAASRGMANRKVAKQTEAADMKIEEVNLATSKAVANDIPEDQIPLYIKAETGLDDLDVVELLSTGNAKLRVPVDKNAALAEQEVVKMATSKDRGAMSTFFDDLLGSTSTRMKEVAAPVMNKMRRLDFDTSVKTHQYQERVAPLYKAMNAVPKEERGKLSSYLSNGEYGKARSVLAKHAGEDGVNALNNTKAVLNELHGELGKAGLKLNKVANYFPRQVKDVEKLIKSLGGVNRGRVEKALYDKAKELNLSGVHKLEPDVKEQVINQVVRGIGPKDGAKPRYTKGREIDNVTEDMAQYYETPDLALDQYIRRTVNDIEKRKFLGKDNVVKGQSDWKIDVDQSVGAFIAKEIADGNMSYKAADEVAATLGIRLGAGEQQPAWIIRKIRDIGYGATLANPLSAFIQFGDLGSAAYQSNLKNTAKAMFAGDKRANMQALGLDDLISSELNAATDTSKLLGNALKYTGFRAADRVGKNVVLKAAFGRATDLVKTPQGIASLAKKYRKQFGTEEFNGLVKELQNGEVSDRVKFYLWNELADVQPISLAEMPKIYLNNPNGRIMYALKSFTIKQLDMVRRGVYDELRKGDKKEAAKNAIGFVALVGGSNSVVSGLKDVALGRKDMGEFVNEIPDGIVEHVGRTVFLDKYNVDRNLSKGNVVDGAVRQLVPPMAWIEAPMRDIYEATREDGVPEGRVTGGRTISQLPLAGRLFDNFLNGGLERAIERREKEED